MKKKNGFAVMKLLAVIFVLTATVLITGGCGKEKDKTSNVSTIESCKGCNKFVYTEDYLYIGRDTAPEEAKDDYKELTDHPYFLGLVTDKDTGVIERAFACAVENGTTFCLEGYDKTTYSNNVDILNKVFPNCNASTSDSLANCDGSSVRAYAYSSGHVSVYDGDGHCDVYPTGDAYCY